MARSNRSTPSAPQAENLTNDQVDPPATDQEVAADLNFRQAQTALELALSQLQASDLDVEAMADLYRRAGIYADRCERLLVQVEQEVMQWDPDSPSVAPQAFTP
jgi:exodeoxyribonuclease VII small subunit